MAPSGPDRKTEKSYLSSAVDSINPWAGSRSSTPTPKELPPQPVPVPSSRPGDHSITHLYGQSTKSYPADCPPLNVLWYHATDVPKRKPQFLRDKPKPADDIKPPPQPKKFVPFSKSDSRAIETAYQRLLEDSERRRGERSTRNASSGSRRGRTNTDEDGVHSSLETSPEGGQTPKTRVPVNEDYLFDVDIEQRELAPVYWLGPVYEVRRGTWFYDEGSTLRPCEENLASQLEEGYLKVKPWTYPKPRIRSDSKNKDATKNKDVTPKASVENLKATASASASASNASAADGNSKPQPQQSQTQHQPSSHRLFGAWMNSVATYQDTNTAWITSDSVLSWVTSTMYERFAGGGFMSGIKLVRGWSDVAKNKKDKQPATPTEANAAANAQMDEKQQKLLKRRSAPPTSRPSQSNDEALIDGDESRGNTLQRQISSLMEGAERNQQEQEEEIRKREEKEIENDYNGQFGETQGRDIEHLVLVTHGIGQLLGIRMESVNFVHDVNILRKNFKSVYSSSADLRALNSELEDGPRNCRVQVLPVCWRHLLDFPRKREKKNEQDISDGAHDDDEYPSLEDITIEGVAFARSLISDLALDVLLYQSAYREQIAEIVLKESNRIFKLFLARNPEFKGKVHIIGHSLGSAIMFDILCRQKEKSKTLDSPRNPLRFWAPPEKGEGSREANELKFEFDVEDFYCLGSPVGLFQMLKGRTISARHLPNAQPSESPLNPDLMDDPFLSAAPTSPTQRVSAITGLPYSVSSPKAAQLFNIFHPSDPISYRLEPLISPAMSTLKPQVLPYTKKGIFGNVAQQGLSGIGMKVGQSVSGLWSSLSAGIASNLLNRSLGLSNEDVAKMNSASTQPQGTGTGPHMPDNSVISDVTKLGEKTNERKKQLADSKSMMGRTSISGNEMTLIDDELETLYSKFQEKRVDLAKRDEDGGAAEWIEAERKAQKLRREEMKVRALNRNGRVDYSIQESVLDFNPMNTIASHMSYWSDEDVSHFILSQLLSNRARANRR
ncbi:putative phospholipase C20G8.02, mitochondrial [Colletotrichum chlorophyti]|uniref:Putative phospholipase C20G8.02, mitochondrial n=1 Tax=Colletotrichum chlorophyti TaxID=708187 RepID=A0A1Q8RPS0_9PEZI|nr:putative phospholipase C20G8.02, mitochondrial [Colletotrichum chlorophyti]